MSEERRFPMHDGPWIPWSLAELLFRAYDRMYGAEGLDMERLAARGGFSWTEVMHIFNDLRRRDRAMWHELMVLSGRSSVDIKKEEKSR